MLDAPLVPAPVLIVDDDPAIREMLRRIMENVGYFVLEAEGGKLALVQLEGKSIGLLVIDQVMPDGEGLETIQTIKHAFPALKIIAISGGDPSSNRKNYGHTCDNTEPSNQKQC